VRVHCAFALFFMVVFKALVSAPRTFAGAVVSLASVMRTLRRNNGQRPR
jgi:hypothetical protein